MTSTGGSPSEAARRGDLPATRAWLSALAPSSPWPRDAEGHTPVHWAAMSDTPAMLELIVMHVTAHRSIDARSSAPAQLDQTPLHWACVAGNTDAIRTLLAVGADPAVLDDKGYSAATHVVHYGRADLLHMLLRENPALLRIADAEGHTLLQWAAYYDHHSVVVYLLRVCQVDPNTSDKTGMTALHRAAQRDYTTITDALLRAGANVLQRSSGGKTPLEVAPDRSRTAYLLRLWGKGVLTTSQPVHSRHTVPKYGLVLFYYVLGIASFVKYRSELIRGLPLGAGLNGIFHLCIVVSFVSHLTATFSDPGDMPQGTAESFVSDIEEALCAGTSEVALLSSAYCFTCLRSRPPRSKHSRERDRCVKVFDHECPWVNNSVGLYTHKPLLLLVLATAIGEWLLIYAMIMSLQENPDVFSVLSALVESPLICLLVLSNALVSLFCVALFWTHIRLVLRGRTTYEHLTAVRDKLLTNRYDFGPWRNLVNFLTSTGPGTGKVSARLSLPMLQEVVLSTGRNTSEKSSPENACKQQLGSIASTAEVKSWAPR